MPKEKAKIVEKKQKVTETAEAKEKPSEPTVADETMLKKAKAGKKKQDAKLAKEIAETPADSKVPEDAGTRVPASAVRDDVGALVERKISGIRQIERTESYEVPANAFKLSERVKAEIKRFDTKITTYVPKGATGVFYGRSKNVGFHNINDVHTVAHEISHFIDDKLGITDKLTKPIGVDKKGFNVYDQKNRPLRKELTDIYVRFYAGARATDLLSLRLAEGYATLQEKFLDNPSMIKRDYPLAYSQFILNAPQIQKEFNDGMASIVQDYLNLSAKDRIGSVITTKTKNEEADSFLNWRDRIKTVMFDALYPVYKMEKIAGTTGVNSTYNILQQNNTLRMRTWKNLAVGNTDMSALPGVVDKFIPKVAKDMAKFAEKLFPRGYYNFSGGTLRRMYDYNWADLVRSLDNIKMQEDFGEYLVVRDQHFQWQKLDELKEKAILATEELKRPDIT